MHKVLLVAMLLAPSARAAVDQNAADLVTEILTAALAKERRLDVLSSADVRRQVEVVANKSMLGCDENSASCLAELAGAMGAQLVVYGKLGTLDDTVLLTLNLFDSSQAKAAGRVVVRAASLTQLSDRVDAAALELVAAYVAALPAGGRAKLLVLDVEAPRQASAVAARATAPEAPPSAPWSALTWGGIGGLAGGVAVTGLGVGLYFVAQGADVAADDHTVDAVKANGLYDQRDALTVATIGAVAVGAVAVVAGGVVLGLSFME